MVWGALYGRIFGLFMMHFQKRYPHWGLFSECPEGVPCVSPGLYSFLGAMSTLTGITKLTVSVTVIMFELTGNLNHIIPCMITVTTSKIVSDYFEKTGISRMLIDTYNLPFLDQQSDVFIGQEIELFMTDARRLTVLYAENSLDDMKSVVNVSVTGFPVIASPNTKSLIGYVRKSTLLYLIDLYHDKPGSTKVYFDEAFAQSDSINLQNYVDRTPLSVDPSVKIESVIGIFQKLGPRVICCKKDGILKGLITKKDIISIIRKEKSKSDDASLELLHTELNQ
jgi:chloride channel 3/4/5